MIIVLLGASGSGKSTLEHELATHHGFEKIISYTTRQPRESEENGKDYYFVDNDTFNEILDRVYLQNMMNILRTDCMELLNLIMWKEIRLLFLHQMDLDN